MPQLEKGGLFLKPVPPFRLDLTSWALRRRQSNTIDRFDGTKYQRAITLGDKVVDISVFELGSRERPRLRIEIEGERISSDQLRSAKRTLDLLLGLRIDLSNFYRSTRRNPKVWELAERFKGVKPPRFPSIFETLLNAISCQQVSLVVGLLLLNRLTWSYGRSLTRQNDTTSSSAVALHAFPLPCDLCNLKPNDLRKLGFSTQKSKYIIGLAKAIINGEVNLENLSSMGDEQALDYLQTIPGIGRWSSQYVLLRGLGRLHRFPADDVGAQNGLMRLLGLRKKPDYNRTIQLIEPWQPYAGVIYFHLLLNRLQKEGAIFVA